MILKKIWIIDKITYYRTKIRLTLENKSLYALCGDCQSITKFCRYKEQDCAMVNYILVSEGISYRYFPYAPKKKIRCVS